MAIGGGHDRNFQLVGDLREAGVHRVAFFAKFFVAGYALPLDFDVIIFRPKNFLVLFGKFFSRGQPAGQDRS